MFSSFYWSSLLLRVGRGYFHRFNNILDNNVHVGYFIAKHYPAGGFKDLPTLSIASIEEYYFQGKIKYVNILILEF